MLQLHAWTSDFLPMQLLLETPQSGAISKIRFPSLCCSIKQGQGHDLIFALLLTLSVAQRFH